MLKKSNNARSGPGWGPILCSEAILDLRIGFLMHELVYLAYLISKKSILKHFWTFLGARLLLHRLQ